MLKDIRAFAPNTTGTRGFDLSTKYGSTWSFVTPGETRISIGVVLPHVEFDCTMTEKNASCNTGLQKHV